MYLTVGIFGDEELVKELGKKGTVNDMKIYHHASSEGVFTFVYPDSEKIQTLLQTLNMIDVPILVVDEITKEIGETIIAIDEIGFEKGFIVSEIYDAIKPMISGTCLENFDVISRKEIREKIMNIDMERDSEVYAPIDTYFSVKSVGTVVLCLLKGGKIKKYDKIMLEPIGKEVLIKGIQSQDKDLQEACSGMRLGLNVKGVDVDEIKRGFVLSNKMEKKDEFSFEIKKNKFFKQEIKKGMQVHVCIGLQVVTGTIENTEPLKVKTLQPLAYRKNDRIILAAQSDIVPRIIGHGFV